jgi:phosphatidylinositol 4-phosphatase
MLWTELVIEVDATRRHLQEQVSLYGVQSLVNLVDQKGYEKPVKEAYERIVAKVSVVGHTFLFITLLTA